MLLKSLQCTLNNYEIWVFLMKDEIAINPVEFFPLLGILSCILLFPINAFADAHVDGFFPRDFVAGGVFEQNDLISEEVKSSRKRESFFITREERRRNPEKAPSHSIQIEQRPNVRISNRRMYPYPPHYPYPSVTLPLPPGLGF